MSTTKLQAPVDEHPQAHSTPNSRPPQSAPSTSVVAHLTHPPPTPISEPPKKQRPRIKQELSPTSSKRRKNPPPKLERFTPEQEAWLLSTVAELYPSPTDKRDWGFITAEYNKVFSPPRTYHGLSVKYTHLSGKLAHLPHRFVWVDKTHGKWLVEHIEQTYLDSDGNGADDVPWDQVNEEFKRVWKTDYGEAGLWGRFVRLWEPKSEDTDEEMADVEEEEDEEDEEIVPERKGGGGAEQLSPVQPGDTAA